MPFVNAPCLGKSAHAFILDQTGLVVGPLRLRDRSCWTKTAFLDLNPRNHEAGPATTFAGPADFRERSEVLVLQAAFHIHEPFAVLGEGLAERVFRRRDSR